MADLLNIFEAPINTISKGIEGKLILLHSNERKLGKTLQATRFPKPLYLRFEQGINAIPGVAYMPLNKWSDFKKVRKQLTNPKTIAQAKDTYTTLIVDTLDVAIHWCETYVCSSQGVDRLNDGNNGYGLWKEYENEWFNEWNSLLNAGYAIIFISHSEIKKMKDPRTGAEYEQMYPKGDKRTIDMIIDACDFIGYVKSNGFDEDGNPQMSSVYFRACPSFLAGSRFEYMPDEVTPFTAEGVLDGIKKAVEMKEAETGVAAVSYETRKEVDAGETESYDEAMEKVKGLFQQMLQKDKDKTVAIVENYLGAGGKISATTPKQLEQILMIIDEFEQELDGE